MKRNDVFEQMKYEIDNQADDVIDDLTTDLAAAKPNDRPKLAEGFGKMEIFKVMVKEAETIDALADAMVFGGFCGKEDRYEAALKMGLGEGGAGTPC